MINVFIPHRWNNEDYEVLSALLDRTKYNVRDYSVPSSSPFDRIDKRFSVDPQIQRQIQHASVVVCSNRPAINNGIPPVRPLTSLHIHRDLSRIHPQIENLLRHGKEIPGTVPLAAHRLIFPFIQSMNLSLGTTRRLPTCKVGKLFSCISS